VTVLPTQLLQLVTVARHVDILCMIDFELEQWKASPEWAQLLEAYVVETAAEKDRNPEFDGWIVRLATVAGIEDSELGTIHGKLIALDLLKFQLETRTSGLTYQVTHLGKHMLKKGEYTEEKHAETDLKQSA
jgi:hypothetical protein